MKFKDKTSYSRKATHNLAKLFGLKHSERGYFDCMDGHGNMVEFKVTRNERRYEKGRKNPFSMLSKYQKANTIFLGYIIMGLCDKRSHQIKKAFKFDVKNLKFKKGFNDTPTEDILNLKNIANSVLKYFIHPDNREGIENCLKVGIIKKSEDIQPILLDMYFDEKMLIDDFSFPLEFLSVLREDFTSETINLKRGLKRVLQV